MASGGTVGRYARLARHILAAAAFAAVLPATGADANTRLCRQLEAQLAATSRGGGSSAQARRYDAAIARQQEQMSKARGQMQQAGCGRAIFGQGVAFCGTVRASLAKMEKNLAELQRTRARMGGGGNRQERARIHAALEANGCRAPQRAVRAAAKAPAATAAKTPAGGQAAARAGPSRLSGNFRTMCVRTCDGYYFPISWSVSRAAFERDRNICAAMCPGVEVALYYHRVPDEESEAMVSVETDAPYTEMPGAFLYRQPNASVPQGCSCEAATASTGRGFTIVGGDHGPGIAGQTPETAPKADEPDMPADPKSDLERDFDPATLKRLTTPEKPPASDAERSVRVVGPAFLPDPEAAIDLQAPARDPAP